MNSLKVSDLKYNYKKVEALKGISFEVSDGLVGVLGPNGAGKTTAMKLISTLFSIQSGEIYLNDFNYKKDIREIRQNLGYLPQDFSTYGSLNGREFLEIIADLKLDDSEKKKKNCIDEIVEKLNMSEYIDRKVKGYSGGMRQKLGFAQVMIGNPKIIVVDEPTAGLDPEQRNYIRELFPIISTNRIVLVTTHIVEDIEFYCKYLLVIKKGELIYKGKKDDFIKEVQGMLWQAEVDKKSYDEVLVNGKILTTNYISNDCTRIKYMSKEPLTSGSVNVDVNLQDAYIMHSNLKGDGTYND